MKKFTVSPWKNIHPTPTIPTATANRYIFVADICRTQGMGFICRHSLGVYSYRLGNYVLMPLSNTALVYTCLSAANNVPKNCEDYVIE